MNSEISKFLDDYKNNIDKNIKFLYFSRGAEFQKEAIMEFEDLRKKVSSLKLKMISNKDEESANILLSLEYLTKVFINELTMLLRLKEDKMDEAWNSLIYAQSFLRCSFLADDIVLKMIPQYYTNKLYLLEKLLFPHQTFLSIGGVVEASKCSICGQEYGTCDHLMSKPYMGKLCSRIITKFKELKETSLVYNPGSKLCRIMFFSDNGFMRDTLTWRKGSQKVGSS